MTRPLEGRRVLVTGGASGIGAAAVDALAGAGASVAATHHVTTPPGHLAATWVRCDVRDSSAVDATVRHAVDALGGLGVLIHAAGLWQPGIPGQISEEEVGFLVDTNLKATIYANRAPTPSCAPPAGGSSTSVPAKP